MTGSISMLLFNLTNLKFLLLNSGPAYWMGGGNLNYLTARIVVLPEEWFARFRDLFSFAKENSGQLLLEKQHFPLLKESLRGIEGSYAGKLRKWMETPSYEELQIPEEIKADLRDYQKKGFSWMWKLYDNDFGGCLADDMGLGKTLQTLTLIQQVIHNERQKHCGPANSRYERQLTIFDAADAAPCKSKAFAYHCSFNTGSQLD